MKKTLFLDADIYSGAQASERRQQERFPIDHRAEIKVIAKDGSLISDEVSLEDWSDTGCRFVSGIPLKSGDVVSLKPIEGDQNTQDTREPRLFEVIWTNRRIAFWVAGAVKLQGEHPATCQFPPWNTFRAPPSK